MFRINSIMNESRDKVRVYGIDEKPHSNYYTILTGDNASGKSSLLSKAINFFLFNNKKDNYLEPAIELVNSSEKFPSKIIALCNSRFDKFTSNVFFNNTSSEAKIATPSMFYIHPETNHNSRKEISRVVDQCLKNSLRLKKTRNPQISNNVNEAFMMFGLQSQLHLKCVTNTQKTDYICAMLSSLINGKMVLSDKGITRTKKERYFINDDLVNRNSRVDESIEFIWQELESHSEAIHLFDILSMIHEGKFNAENIGDVYFSIAEGIIHSERKNLFFDFTDIAVIRHLFLLDVFSVSDFQVMHLNSNKEVSIISLSSGQRTLFGNAIVLSSFAERNSMICIDEPENSLHPEWQLNFMRFISLLCPDELGAHVFIATHSPQIISGMQYDNGCVLSLSKRDTVDSITIRKENKNEGENFYELQPLNIYREQSADKQLTGVFKSPGYKNDFIIRKLLLILSKSSKEITLSEKDEHFITEIDILIQRNRIPEGDPVEMLFKQVNSFLKERNSDD